jgi:hypothetical protein
MYADDGIFIGKNFSPLRRFIWELNTMGIELAPEKSKMVDDIFNFLGFTISKRSGTISRDDLGQINYRKVSEETLMQWLRDGGGLYGNKEEPNKK